MLLIRNEIDHQASRSPEQHQKFLKKCEDYIGNLTKEGKLKSAQPLVREGKNKRKAPEIVFREGKPSAVILDIDDYREMLERLEDIEDLNTLKQMRKRPLKFRRLEDFLKKHHPRS